MTVVALVGNPREGSRTLTVATRAAHAVGLRLNPADLSASANGTSWSRVSGNGTVGGGSAEFGSAEFGSAEFGSAELGAAEPNGAPGAGRSYEVVDLSALGPHLLAPGAHPGVEVALELVREASVLVVASPTYKGTYTGLLKSFLDRLPPQALAGTAALPLLVMGDAKHALAVEVHLRPLLVELGASVPTPGLAFLEADFPRLEEVVAAWTDRIAPQVRAITALRPAASAAASRSPA
ncbi:NAD(P)H-dependent oxidoreductase [Nonomuraea fuscirosea]|uniref:NADPH-dependent FMN reductase n=1 Tax=Nonomuraea fuscirosea TaxID=1291556 RepID=UPI002DD9F374|nr:NAD(P)H-dependent oxidoreductase [Nonomuraea fuscirosea]WSA48985.1 NAD(P)H-dependent oxidoreductase [Nonomuraea fuscirosea]